MKYSNKTVTTYKNMKISYSYLVTSNYHSQLYPMSTLSLLRTLSVYGPL